MKAIAAGLAIACAFPGAALAEDKGAAIEAFITLQERVYQIAKGHPNPFTPGTSTLNEEVAQQIDALRLEELDSDQLFRLATACFLAGWPQRAGEQHWDLVFDDVCWRCVRIMSSRPGDENAHHLKRMKALFGTDGAESLWFTEYIERQSKLKS